MSHTRLLFLYPPTLFTLTSKLITPAGSAARRCINTHSIRTRPRPGVWGVKTTIHARGRHGKAVEPGPEFQKQQEQREGGVAGGKDVSSSSSKEKEVGEVGAKHKDGRGITTGLPSGAGQVNSDGLPSPSSSPLPSSSPSPPSPPPAEGRAIPQSDPSLNSNPLPTSPTPSLPHLFDTYSLVHRLTPPFTLPQSIHLMYLLRHLLHTHLTHAHNTFLSRSTFTSTTYLFRASSSELRSEIFSLRATQLEKMRAERAQIQRDFELLNGRFMEELMVCGNEMRAMFNDRKMVNKSEQREVENKIQELNYKITVLMGSELKSEVEKLRWVTTRRGLIAIGVLAVFIVSLIKLSQNSRKREKELEKARASAEAAAEHGNGHGHGGGGGHIPVDGRVHTTGSLPLS
ncbi:hypothetical protein EV426DRAFT_405433 [Tirmania nivea]|nr:hypothetical protein EV426DRAFT_405433 [Tirmania nivea]